MRIGIDARFLTHPQEGGFKSYSENLVRGLCETDSTNEYVLYVDREPKSLDLPSAANFRIKAIGGSSAPLREQFHLPNAMKFDRLDLAHFLCNTAPVFVPCRSVLTIHDLIPCKLRTPRRSLKDGLIQTYWRKTIPVVAKRADHIITVSQASKADICTTLKLPSKKVTVIPTGYHPAFRPLPNDRDAGRMCARLGLVGRFVLGFASADPRKNIAVFLTAMSRVRAKVPNCRALVVCTSEAVEDEVRALAQGVLDEKSLKLLSGLTRNDLAMVYNLAEVVLFPSLYEGFGLPVVEAMACGTPVVTSNVSSLPEVAGDAAVLINPRDPVAAADAVVRLLTNDAVRRRNTQAGLAQAQNFQWQKVVQSTISVYEGVVNGQVHAHPFVSHSLGGEAG